MEKVTYEVPQVEIIEVEVEKGFATSGQQLNTADDQQNMGVGTGGF